MDTLIKIIIISLLHLIVTPANAIFVDISDANGALSGWIKNADGNYSQTSTNSIRPLVNNTTLSVAEKFPIQTTKGIFQADITRVASVDLARLGKTITSVAVASGPIGMTLTAVSLICELSNICNQAGQWVVQANDPMPGAPNSYPASDGKWTAWGNRHTYSPEAGCRDEERLMVNIGAGATYSHTVQLNADTYQCYAIFNGSTFYASNTSRTPGCSQGYTLTGSDCVKTGVTESHPATASDWTSKEQLLNDPRFTPELIAKDQPVPIGIPSLPSVWKAPIDKTTTTLKDGSGNVTGTEESTTEAEISNPTSQENPTNNPNLVKVTETTVKNTYNINNQLTSSTTTTTGNQNQQPQPQGFEIDIDNMTDQPLEERAIPGTFSYTSWGSGSCPADRSVSYHYGTLNLTFQPACDAAVMANPVIIAIAGLAAMFIISGALRND